MSRKRRLPPFETEITCLGPKGVGVGLAPDGRAVHVRRAPPGSRVRVRPAGRKKGIWKGVRTALIRPPAAWIPPPCPVFGLCGGCVLQELDLGTQRSLKLARAKEEVGPTAWEGVTGAPEAYGFRNKMEFSFGVRRYLSEADMAAERPIAGRFLGLHAPGRFDRVVDVATCPLMDAIGNAALSAVREDTLDSDVPLWDVRSHEGLLRHLLIRRGDRHVLIGLFTATPPPGIAPIIAGWIRRWAALELGVGISVVWMLNDEVADVARGSLKQREGPPMMPIRLGAQVFQLAPLAFFQTSTPGAQILVDTIGIALGAGHTRLLDLYCGTGAIGICLSDHADEVVGIEVVAEAVDNAQRNAIANGVKATYRVAKVEDALDALVGGPGVAAGVDPPRAGLHPGVARKLAETALDVLVYVACNPASLGRDRLLLEAGGWVLERCWAVDLFPQTGHLEVVARFVRT